MESFSGAALDHQILNCAERWGYSGKGSSYNPILGPLLLKIFRKQVGDDEVGDAQLRPLLEICKKKEEQFSVDVKITCVVIAVVFLGLGICQYRAEQNLKKKDAQTTCKNPRLNKTA